MQNKRKHNTCLIVLVTVKVHSEVLPANVDLSLQFGVLRAFAHRKQVVFACWGSGP